MAYRDTKAAVRALAEIAVTQGGYFTARQAGEAGYGSSHLRYHLAAGNFERAGHGLYRIPTLPRAEHDDLLRLRFWSRDRDDQPQAVVSHQTALALHELAEFIPTQIHLTVPTTFRKRPPKGCTLHKATVPASDATEVDSLRVTTTLRTLRDLASDATMPTEQFQRAVEGAAERGLIRRSQASELTAIRREIPSPNTARATKAARSKRGRA
ncbi:MAG TPA: type IV toxin-antitoxin system AbiEi family antitoxin domain-containing protein [Phycisphaerales bacterium]|nr:type IV toxin-antitoxin system AbiEi family antitoxin domain-containing protein [Phycisphaerales bacterium]HMP38642.1 type IV toxin-antitoxin system AbiEi family antitoxin domain-containing protein [Phycisphaerales bacterium]